MGAPKLDSQLIVKKIDELPSLPAVVYELSRVMNDPMSSTKEVEAIMARDIGMTAKVLKLANSAYYAIPGGASSLSRAINFIGFDTIHQLVLSASIIKALEIKKPTSFDINEFWRHSIGVAIAAETIAKHVQHSTPSDLFICGLVHDMGKLALYLISTDAIQFIADEAEKNKNTFFDTEITHGYTNHAELGQMLCAKWQLPKSIHAATRFHHEKDLAKRGCLSTDLNQVVDIVMLANLLIHALKFGNSGHTHVLGAPNELLERLMINPKSDMSELLKKIKSNLESAAEFIRLIGVSS